ncbi:MAG: 50S ribosomal protein L10 [Thermodesulfobacteriota bacterium]|nr:50S ribosomal protein L10 [Thermodesulfobacteriota bacterium]
MDRKEKREFVREFGEKIRGYEFAFLADFSGLDVEKINTLRNDLKKAYFEFQVVKNNLFRLSIQDSSFEELSNHLFGPTAVSFGNGDPTPLAKLLTDFAKNNENLKLQTGILQGKLLSAKEIEALAKLPKREEMLGMLLSVLKTSQSGFVNLLSAIPMRLFNALNMIKENKEKNV